MFEIYIYMKLVQELTLLVWGKILLYSIGGGRQNTSCNLFSQKLFLFYFELKLKVLVMTQTISNREISFIEVILCEYRYFSLLRRMVYYA